jgi:hypothetical protein
MPVTNVTSKFRTSRSSANAMHLVSIIAFVSGGALSDNSSPSTLQEVQSFDIV